jgi:hypothetical protein
VVLCALLFKLLFVVVLIIHILFYVTIVTMEELQEERFVGSSGSVYHPSSAESSSGSNSKTSSAEENACDQKPNRKGRQRSESLRGTVEEKMNNGQGYVTRKGKTIAEKKFVNEDCLCRINVFQKYWKRKGKKFSTILENR